MANYRQGSYDMLSIGGVSMVNCTTFYLVKDGWKYIINNNKLHENSNLHWMFLFKYIYEHNCSLLCIDFQLSNCFN
jgi:hypothetical protein